jgi:hypothetical protein
MPDERDRDGGFRASGEPLLEGEPMNRAAHLDAAAHESTWLLLPWFANGTLGAAESRHVESHLAACEGCRNELQRCRDLAAALRHEPEAAPSPHPIQLARLMSRLDEIDTAAARDALTGADEAAAIDATPGRLATLFAATPRPVRYTLAGQLAALLLLALALSYGTRLPAGGHAATPSAPAAPGAATPVVAAEGAATPAAIGSSQALFHTLSAPSAGADAPSAAPRPQIRLVFSEQATERQIRDVLMKVRGRLVDGPSPLGTYTIEIPAPPATAAPASSPAGTSDTAASPRRLRPARPADGAPDSLGIVLAYLTAQPIVRFAEPVAGMPSADMQTLPQP